MQIFVISLGGSLIVPEEIDTGFLEAFKKTILKHKSKKFVIVCGGGKTARKYQNAAKPFASKNDLDWLGVYSTRINALLLKSAFGSSADEKIIEDPTKRIISKKSIIISGGWKPGWSTDYISVLLAKKLKAKEIINMTNTDYVYDKDPSKNKDAKPIKCTTWKGYRALIGKKWEPGLNAPFDPVASKEAEKLKIKVFVVGRDLNNLENLLNGKKFKGSTIL